MPSILNLKFKGQKSFVAFTNLSDVDSITKTWKVCTKVATYLDQGQRLENLSWRLWHLQNLMVDIDNSKSKRELKKLSRNASDQLDKEKGRSIQELDGPDFKRNHFTDMIRQRAVEKERSREASQNAKSSTIKCMPFTFSIDMPAAAATARPFKKLDLKSSPESKKRLTIRTPPKLVADADDQALTQCGRKDDDTTFHFPSLFSNDFAPAALFAPSPTLTTSINYGEGPNAPNLANDNDSFSIPRPTIELPLDEILNGVDSGDSPGPWSPAFFNDKNTTNTTPLFSTTSLVNSNSNINTNTGANDPPVFYLPSTSDDLTSSTTLSSTPPVNETKLGPTTNIKSVSAPTKLRSVKTRSPTPRPNPTVCTSANSSGDTGSATPTSASGSTSTSMMGTSAATSGMTLPMPFNTKPPLQSAGALFKAERGNAATMNNMNNIPSGQTAECLNCGATHTPLWRRGLNDELNCNACGLYFKLHRRPRPKTMRNQYGKGHLEHNGLRPETAEVMTRCNNCHTTATPLWRKDDEGKTNCNACGLYYKQHGSARPISMKADVIRKRSRDNAKSISGGAEQRSTASENLSASSDVSRRASPSPELVFSDRISFGGNDRANPDASPSLVPDSSTVPNNMYDHLSGSTTGDNMDIEYPSSTQSGLMGMFRGGDSGNGESSPNSQSDNTHNPNSSLFTGGSGTSTNASLYHNIFNFQLPGPYKYEPHLQYSSYSLGTAIPLDRRPFPSGDYESDLHVDWSMSPQESTGFSLVFPSVRQNHQTPHMVSRQNFFSLAKSQENVGMLEVGCSAARPSHNSTSGITSTATSNASPDSIFLDPYQPFSNESSMSLAGFADSL
ncbi:hypothetical protein GYMLUDRAFT_59059 [Collybiopsis luxurians FD-317 M1]|uniref:GATA-type domain-containing protein n=1 Tax=Collybiopsis luxurians FD-317 M1 TaxID=944289 RepID=A0A0D0BBK2_9AGAR|nr:hypothetical protein GYMLUDRAFT_59059 [Collybiopsis luxurians FD-317 M1]